MNYEICGFCNCQYVKTELYSGCEECINLIMDYFSPPGEINETWDSIASKIENKIVHCDNFFVTSNDLKKLKGKLTENSHKKWKECYISDKFDLSIHKENNVDKFIASITKIEFIFTQGILTEIDDAFFKHNIKFDEFVKDKREKANEKWNKEFIICYGKNINKHPNEILLEEICRK